MIKNRKEKVEKSVDVVEIPSVVIPESEVKSAKVFTVKWKGGEEVFKSFGEAEFAVRTRVGGYIV